MVADAQLREGGGVSSDVELVRGPLVEWEMRAYREPQRREMLSALDRIEAALAAAEKALRAFVDDVDAGLPAQACGVYHDAKRALDLISSHAATEGGAGE